ncbi:uracil-DNA glycosylase [Duganella ginsengisoli]|uniref:Type-4 uracil-DNA glycosylase n=2 Tax=Pseudoduganella ginsengisoli TaxID=1462440 RepID=A0A6L6Q212_9BURK|nr:uracil-DNA glycosylase [Pseudoduganella ginsengisoli]
MPDDGMPWFDDAPLPSFDAAFDGLYDEPAEDAGISDAAIARMDWPALRAAVQSCTRCALCRERSAAVPGRGPESAPWLVLATAPNGDDEVQGRPLAGAPGQLLDNMLKAINVAPDKEAYVATLVKCRPQNDRAPGADEVAACRPYLEREMALAGSRAIITLGHTAAKGLLGAAARGKVLRLEHIPVVATYHPADLLRKPEDKAKAWADLCLARSAYDVPASI